MVMLKLIENSCTFDEVGLLARVQNKRLSANKYKDGTCEGWKCKTEALGLLELKEKVAKVESLMDRVYTGNIEISPTNQELLNCCADIANNAMQLADQLGILYE